MEEETPTTTPSGEGAGAETPPQESEVTSQEAQPTQPPENVQVENSPTSQPSEHNRSLPSTHYEIRQLKKELKRITELLSKTQNPSQTNQVPVKPTYDPNEDKAEEEKLINKPISYIRDFFEKKFQEREEALLKKLREEEIPTYYNKVRTQTDHESNTREAWKLIFPKLDFNEEDSLEKMQEKEPSYYNAIESIMNSRRLFPAFNEDPVGTAKYVLELYKEEQKNAKKSPLAASKAALGSTAGGSPIGGSKTITENELNKKRDALEKKLDSDRTLLNDEKFMKEWEEVKEALVNFKA